MITNNIQYITGYVTKHIKSLCVVFVALFSVSSALLSIGVVFRKLVDNGVSSDQVSEIHNAVFLISVLIGVFAVGSFFRSYFINVIATKVVSKLKSDTYRALLKVNIDKYEDLKVGDIISRLGSDIEIIGSLIINFLSFFVRNFIMLFGAVILMFIQSPKLSLMVIISVPIFLLPLLKLSKHVRALSRSVMAEQGALAANIDESFSGIRTLYAYNQQGYLANKFDTKIDSYIKNATIRLRLRSIFFAMAIVIISGSITAVIWVGSIDIISGKMSSGQMISFIYYAIIVGMSAGGIAELFSEIQGPLAALDRVIELKNMANLSKDKKVGLELNTDFAIKFDRVSFSYPARPGVLALDNISLDIKQGSFTGIVGQSGSGKSTLMQLLLKFYQHNSGNISIGGLDIHMINDDDIRKRIAYVEQHPTIFSGTIKSNIAFSNPDASDEEVNLIAKLCGVTDFTNVLELGIDTEIGERGIRISGGQKQRIAIARALLYKPEILMLDEATSALDNDSEKKILKNIMSQLKGKTIISIAHRVSSIENADEIFVISHGSLESCGKHRQLLRNSKIYNLLYNEQEKE